MSNYLQQTISYLKYPFYVSSGIVGLASTLLYLKQTEIIYPRSLPANARTEVPKPSQFGIPNYEEIYIPTPDGERLHSYLIRPSNPLHTRPLTILMFHGNAGNIGHRIPIARVLEQSLGCNVFMLEYRGYGLSTGDPEEKGIAIDAQAGLDYLRGREDLRATKFVVYGQSLGGAVGIDLVRKNLQKGDIKALILENTFLSIKKMIPAVFPPAKYITWLCHEKWASEEMIPHIVGIPILFMSGLQDEIVPPDQMRQLYELSRVKDKVWKPFPRGQHNDTVAEQGYFEAIEEFIRLHVDKER